MKKPPKICRTCEFAFYSEDSLYCFCTLEMEKRGKVPKHLLTDVCLKYVVDRAFETAIKHQDRNCRVCGCTDDDCSQCIEKTGEPCHWVEWDLCSACADEIQEGGEV
ncbi:hypothetical protein FACS18942_10170 [Planctomycetales bacterium]|nr:hypothetical protein FACS18942_10170 [Planctomycetales bacterium]